MINKILESIRAMRRYKMEMSYDRQTILNLILSYDIRISDHMIYLISYPNDDSVNYWITEISGWLYDIGRRKWAGNNKKLPKKEYQLLFSRPIANKNDLRLVLNDFNEANKVYKEYLTINISDMLVDLGYKFYVSVSDRISDMLASSTIYSSRNYGDIIKDELDKSGLKNLS